MGKTKINWTDVVWNPITGCSKVSAGCAHCYAERMSKRLAGRCGYPKDDPFTVTLHHNKLGDPLKWRKSKRVFVNSMSDLFHNDISNETIDEIFGVMLACHILSNNPDHIFQILTKRPERMHKYFSEREPVELLKAWAEASNWITLDNEDMVFEELVYGATCRDWDERGMNSKGSEHIPWGYLDKLWPLPNVWIGVSIENQAAVDERILLLLQTPAAARFISAEPLLGSLDITPYLNRQACPNWSKSLKEGEHCQYCHDGLGLTPRLDWVICGGESGPGARPMHPDWVRSLRDQCQAADVPFFFKQHGEFIQVGECMNETDDTKFYNAPNIRRVNHNGGMGFHGAGAIYMHRVGKKKAGRELDGRTWDELPEAILS